MVVFLGYDVSVLEAATVGHRYATIADQPLDSPDRSLTPLAFSALQAQYPEIKGQPLPTNMGDWHSELLLPLTQTDLLRDRVTCRAHVRRIEHAMVSDQPTEPGVDPEQDTDSEQDTDPVPPDFKLHFDSTSVVSEAVILACETDGIEMGFQPPTPYFFAIEVSSRDDRELLKQIVDIYAQLAGRDDLDLYRPRRT